MTIRTAPLYIYAECVVLIKRQVRIEFLHVVIDGGALAAHKIADRIGKGGIGQPMG